MCTTTERALEVLAARHRTPRIRRVNWIGLFEHLGLQTPAGAFGIGRPPSPRDYALALARHLGLTREEQQ